MVPDELAYEELSCRTGLNRVLDLRLTRPASCSLSMRSRTGSTGAQNSRIQLIKAYRVRG